jgi:hypothetical protein
MRPPSVGPSEKPRYTAITFQPSARPRWAAGKAATTSAEAVAATSAPPTPCTARPQSSTVASCANPASAEPPQMNAIPAR